MIDTILNFWFDPNNYSQPLYNRMQWWQKSNTQDQYIKNNFADIRIQAIKGKLNHWLGTPKGILAYIVLIDQFSRNIFRGTAAMYEFDHLALQAAKMAVDKQHDQALSLTHRIFIYMPYEHSESILDQEQSLNLFSSIIKDAPEEGKGIANLPYEYAKEHYDVIKKFNRFPHRNIILFRNSSEDEIEFLKMHNGF